MFAARIMVLMVALFLLLSGSAYADDNAKISWVKKKINFTNISVVPKEKRNFLTNSFGIKYLNGQFIGIGYEGFIATSPDGIDWSARNYNADFHLTDVAYSDGKYVAIGRLANYNNENQVVYTSTDGKKWSYKIVPGQEWNNIIWGNNEFVIPTRNGIISSQDGQEWKENHNSNLQGLSNILWTGEQYVGFGRFTYNGKDSQSMEATRTTIVGNEGDEFYTSKMIYANNTYVASGMGSNYQNSDIYISQDAVNWSRKKLLTTTNILDIAYSGKKFVAVGEGEMIATSTDGNVWNNEGKMTADYHSEKYGTIIWTGKKFIIFGSYNSVLISK